MRRVNDELLTNDSDEFEGQVHRLLDGYYEVTMTLQVDAADEAEALQRAMAWRDVVGMWLWLYPEHDARELFRGLGFGWHLHHPWGC